MSRLTESLAAGFVPPVATTQTLHPTQVVQTVAPVSATEPPDVLNLTDGTVTVQGVTYPLSPSIASQAKRLAEIAMRQGLTATAQQFAQRLGVTPRTRLRTKEPDAPRPAARPRTPRARRARSDKQVESV